MSNFYNQASWVLVPSGIEEDIVFAQKPTSGLGDLQFTRASDATYTDSTGVVRRSPYNLVQQSEMFSNAIWTKTSSTIGIDATVAPNGTLTADLFTPANALSGRIDQVTGIAAYNNNIYTGSIYFKKPSSSISNITFYASDGSSAVGTNRIGVTVNLATFAATAYNFGNGVNTTANVTAVGNDWYRAVFTGSISSGATLNWTFVARVLTVDGTINGTNGLFIWGAQLVEGSSALDYFPTTNRQDVPRIDFRNADGTLSSCGRLLLEPQRTNSIRNSSMVGAVAGSPGTLPTNWSITNAGFTVSVVSIGTENGLPYIDFRLNGTATGASFRWQFEGNTIAGTIGQVFTESAYVKRISGTLPQTALQIVERTSGGAALGFYPQNITIGDSLSRFAFTKTVINSTCAIVVPEINVTLVNGQSYDFTIRIAAPQMELGAYATTWVPTTTAAVTRLADFASKTGVSSLISQSQGTLFVEVNDAVLGNVFSGTGRRFLTISDNTLNNRIILFKNSSNDSIQFVVVSSGVEQASISTSINQSGVKKIAAGYANNDFVLYVNGVQIGTDTSGAVPSCDRIALGYETTSNLSNPACPVAQAALFPTRLTNAQLAQLTTL